MILSTVEIRCLKCKCLISPIVLPASIRLKIDESPEAKIPDAFQLVVAWPECKHVFRYSGLDTLRPASGATGQDLSRADRLPVRVTRLCGIDNCGVPLTIHTTVVADRKSHAEVFREVVETAREWVFDYTCPGLKNHHLLKVSLAVYALDGIGFHPEPSVLSNRV